MQVVIKNRQPHFLNVRPGDKLIIKEIIYLDNQIAGRYKVTFKSMNATVNPVLLAYPTAEQQDRLIFKEEPIAITHEHFSVIIEPIITTDKVNAKLVYEILR